MTIESSQPISEEPSDLAHVLYDLLHAYQQSQQTYAQAAREASSAAMTMLFNNRADQREQAATELHQVLFRLKIPAHATSSKEEPPGPNAARQITETHGAQQTSTLLRLQALVAACEHQDRCIRERAEQALHRSLPAELAALIRQQQDAMHIEQID